MPYLTYSRLMHDSPEIPHILALHRLPEISRFISIDEQNYFNYVTQTENVSYFLVYENDLLIGTIHVELNDSICEISLLVSPVYQRKGYGLQVLTDLLNGRIIGGFTAARAWIEEENIPSLRLFEKAGFSVVSREDELVEMVYDGGTAVSAEGFGK